MDLSGDGLLGIGKEIRHGGCLGNKYNAYEATGWKMENALKGFSKDLAPIRVFYQDKR